MIDAARARIAACRRAAAALLVVGLCPGVPGPAALGADVHVATTGADAAAGTAAAPVATLRRALERVREIRAAEPGRATPVVIEVADGRHELVEPLVLLPEDSGTEASPTVIRAAADARPIISGGRAVTGWTVSEVDGQPRWTAALPAVKAGAWRFAQLFVNDQRRFRPRLPATGWYRIAAAVEPTAASAGKGYDRFACAVDELRQEWAGRGDVEVVTVHQWTMSRLPIAALDPNPADSATRIATLAGRTCSASSWCSLPKGNRYLVDNVREALGEPGSWYLDEAVGTLTYCPRDGETPRDTIVIAPVLDRLVEIRGDAAADATNRRTVAHVRFEGLSFAHGNWALPAGGQSYSQADLSVGAAIVATGARDVTFTRCAVRHVGRYAISLGGGCHGCLIDQCELVDLGGGGVLVGSTTVPTAAAAATTRTVIRDTTIAHGGRLHSAAVGVWIGHADHTVVEHCDIRDLTYTGISVGWSWGYGPSGAHHNLIRRNRITGIGQGVLSDMGGIYTLGVSPGTVVEGNVISDVESLVYGGWGLYTDEGSTGIVMRGNLIFRTSHGGFHQHYGRDNVIEHNVFAAARDWQLQRSRVEDHTSFRFERNIVWWASDTPLVKGDWSRGIVTRSNCYWHGGRPVMFPGGGDLAARQAAGQDAHSIVADPGFTDAAAGDFSLSTDSPARRLGIEIADAAAAGPRSGVTLTSSLPAVPTIWVRSAPGR